MKTIIFKAADRGSADHGWLKAKHSFSFASYYDPTKVHFGLLRVLNDDIVAPGMGFGTHPHDNMEIVTIPLRGSLEHKDSMGSAKVIKEHEVQIMSAGTGVTHSEYNPSKTEEVNLLQLWVFPKVKDIEPRYDQRLFSKPKNQFKVVVSPDKSEDALWINQDAYFSLASLDKDISIDYKIKYKGNGAYVFLIEGSIEINGEKLEKRDAIGISDTEKFSFKTLSPVELLVIDVPMH